MMGRRLPSRRSQAVMTSRQVRMAAGRGDSGTFGKYGDHNTEPSPVKVASNCRARDMSGELFA